MLLPDNSGLPDAPIDSKFYGRRDEAWVVPNLADLGNTSVAAPVTGQLLQYDGTIFKWKNANPPNNFPEAPNDGRNYLRNGQGVTWTALEDDAGQIAQNNRLDDLETEQLAQDVRLDDLKTEQLVQDGRLDTIEGQQTTQDNRLTAIESEQITQNTDILNLQTDLANLELADLTDVANTLNPTMGQVLTFDGLEWNAATPTPTPGDLGSLTDVTLTTPAINDGLVYNGTQWVNAPTYPGTLDALTDVTITTPQDKNVLTYSTMTS